MQKTKSIKKIKKKNKAVFINVKMVQKWRRRLMRLLLVISSLLILAPHFFILGASRRTASMDGSGLRKT